MEEAAFLVAVQRIVSGMFGATLLLTFKTTGWRVNRIEGATLLAGYVGYLARAATVVAWRFAPDQTIWAGFGLAGYAAPSGDER